MSTTIIYTAIIGGISDELRQPVMPTTNAEFICFSDQLPPGRHGQWEVRPPAWTHEVPRRASRWHKLMPHRLFPDAEYVIWIDGCLQPLVDLVQAILPSLESVDIAAFQHRQRRCIYEEYAACRRYHKDSSVVMLRQIARYLRAGYPPGNGLADTTCLARRLTAVSANFDEQWWAEIECGSLRDQLSFNYVAWRTGTPYGIIPGCQTQCPFFRYYSHEGRHGQDP